MRICLFAFGKLKTPGLREAADYYKRLIRTWAPIEEIELKPLQVPDKTPASRAQIQQKEGRILLDRIKSESRGRSAYFILDETGKAKTTQHWGQLFRDLEQEGISTVSFCVGSSLGFSEEVRKNAHGALSLGPQTLPHELARVVLCEQLYRAQSVIQGHPYHNEGS